MNTVTPEIEQLIRNIELHTKRCLQGTVMGDAKSFAKGSGFEFDQIREYQVGDDIRHIDWKSSARMGNLLVKQFIEERSRTVLLALDISPSMEFGTTGHTKRTMAAQIGAALALSAHYAKDKVGLILYSDEIELFLPVERGLTHAQRVVRALFTYQSKGSHRETNGAVAFDKLLQLREKNGLLFVLSDCIDDLFDHNGGKRARSIPLLSSMYDVTVVRYLDPLEDQFPAVGFLTVQDSETGELVHIDARSRSGLERVLRDRQQQQDALLKKHGVGILSLRNPENLVSEVVQFFARRASR